MYLGAHGKANALDVIIESAKIIQNKNQYEDIKFIFVGDGPKKEKLKEVKKKLTLENVEFLEPIKKKDVPLLLANADILLISLKNISLYRYGISLNKLFDYMASRKPIIIAGDPSNNIINKASCGISIPPENSEKMAEAIIKLYKMSPEEREEMGRRGYEYVKKNHDIPVLVDKLEKIF